MLSHHQKIIFQDGIIFKCWFLSWTPYTTNQCVLENLDFSLNGYHINTYTGVYIVIFYTFVIVAAQFHS